MNKLMSLVCRALCVVFAGLCTTKHTAASAGLNRAALVQTLRPCPLARVVAQWKTTHTMPPLFALRLRGTSSTSPDSEPGTTSVGSPVFDEVFGALRKRNDRLRLGPGLDERVPSLPGGARADVEYAKRDYSFLRVLPTACLTAGVVTLSLTVGTGERFALQFKPSSLGGLVGFRGRF